MRSLPPVLGLRVLRTSVMTSSFTCQMKKRKMKDYTLSCRGPEGVDQQSMEQNVSSISNASSSGEYSCHITESGQRRIESRRWWKRGNQKVHQRYEVSSDWYDTAAGSSRSSHRYPIHSGSSQKIMNRLCLEANKRELSSY